MMQITSLQAQALIADCKAKALEIGVAMNIAVLDGGGHLKAFARMDKALLGSIDVAIKKAKTAVLFGMNSEAVGEFCKPGGSSPGLDATNDVLVVFAGGVPIMNAAGDVIGGVGISGGSVDQDNAVARVAASQSADPMQRTFDLDGETHDQAHPDHRCRLRFRRRHSHWPC